VTRRDVEERIRRTAWPEPPAELRARILQAAPRDQPAVAWGDRLWFSRAWRWSFAAAAVAIVVIGQWAADRPQPAPSEVPTLARMEALEGLMRQAGLSAEDAAALVQREMSRRATSAPPSVSSAIADLLPAEGAHQ
jgi:hypothetical protein